MVQIMLSTQSEAKSCSTLSDANGLRPQHGSTIIQLVVVRSECKYKMNK